MIPQATTICRTCRLAQIQVLQSPYAFNQVRFKKRVFKPPELWPDHFKKLALGKEMAIDPERKQPYLKDIEAVRQTNLKRLKQFQKGPLYLKSIHGRAEMLIEVMRIYDRIASQKEWAEMQRLKIIAMPNFYLSRAYYILRGYNDRGYWEKFSVTPTLVKITNNSIREKYSLWSNFPPSGEIGSEGAPFDGGGASTSSDVVLRNFRKFMEKFTVTEGSALAKEWVNWPGARSGREISTQKLSTPPPKESDQSERPVIWRPNQKDPALRESTFSHPSQATIAKTTKQLTSTWGPASFRDLNLFKGLVDAVESVTLGHLKSKEISLTDIQALALPIITRLDIEPPLPSEKSELRSFLIAAETGSGKTLAYLIPLINRLKREEEWALNNPENPHSIFKTRRAASPRSVIIVPTAELGEQIYTILKRLSHELKFAVCFFDPQFEKSVIRKSILPKYIDILISTPFRLNEFLQSGELNADHIRYLIIDEADTMFDRAFEGDMNPLLTLFQPHLQTLVLCTATIPVALEQRLSTSFSNMQRIVAPKIHTAPRRVNCSLVVGSDKRQAVLETLHAIQSDGSEPDADIKRTIVFCNSRANVKDIYEYLKSAEDERKSSGRDETLELIPFTRENYDRFSAVERFNEPAIEASNKLRALITTDLGSRGLDTVNTKSVVLFDVPYSNIDLLHRLGRVARAGTRGRAFVILSHKESRGRTREWINDVRDRIIRGAPLI